MQIVDPGYEADTEPSPLAPRLSGPDALAGQVVGVISNGKVNTGPFFDRLARHLHDRYQVAEVRRLVKPNYSAPAGPEIMGEAATWAALFAGVGD
ncbi:MAG: hypothetical protein ACK5PP_11365 [Acidimicrobiales bacterium]